MAGSGFMVIAIVCALGVCSGLYARQRIDKTVARSGAENGRPDKVQACLTAIDVFAFNCLLIARQDGGYPISENRTACDKVQDEIKDLCTDTLAEQTTRVARAIKKDEKKAQELASSKIFFHEKRVVEKAGKEAELEEKPANQQATNQQSEQQAANQKPAEVKVVIAYSERRRIRRSGQKTADDGEKTEKAVVEQSDAELEEKIRKLKNVACCCKAQHMLKF